MTDPENEKAHLVDTNIILRFLLNDHQEHSPSATRFMIDVSRGVTKAEILDFILLECIYVLEKYYEIPRSEIAHRLSQIINFQGIGNSNKATLLNALFNYKKFKIDFADCLMAAYSSTNRVVVSFDKDFNKLKANWMRL